jgi:DNA polymerase-4
MKPFSRKIVHVDMDCFYAAVEMRDNPALRDKPIAVGGESSRRGVLCTSNYVARQFGVRSAMATAHARKLCPDLILLHPNMEKYRKISASIREIFADYSDKVEPLSLDEAFIDVTNCKKLHGSATLIAQEIRQRIFTEHQLTASAGIAPNKFLAKIASDWNKPNGQFVITPDEVAGFVYQLPVRKIPGVGKVTAAKLQALSIDTCADLQQVPLEELISNFGRFGQRLYHLCRGVDNREVESKRERKSLSVEHTFSEDIQTVDSCKKCLDDLFAEMLGRLEGYKDLCIQKQFIKIKFDNFQQTTVECTCTEPSLEKYKELFETGFERLGRPVRLLGMGVGFKKFSRRDPIQLLLNLNKIFLRG